ncbi:uncharacterized protein LOC129947520 [Eupeodes corollae]|uniref:uncharacterized protein LOC129947520 n=1 Tax=Eupeodes corollae TaxID=290404 RepID=UPI002492ECEF|nr:uncharacterized protein LOC129947520 [Eupeodes corollae]
MFNYISIIVTLGLLALTTAKPYTAVGTSQVDVRNNYNTASGYSTSLGYASPLGSRIVASSSPFGYSAPLARYSPSMLAGPFAYGSPSAAARYESAILGAGYASPYAQYASPYVQQISPFAANFVSPYSTAYGSPSYAFGASGSAQILL